MQHGLYVSLRHVCGLSPYARRLPHTMTIRVHEKLRLILKATRQHARNLAMYATVYKSSMLFLRLTSPDGKEAGAHTFLSGLIGGYTVFGRGYQSSVNQQIVIYVFARAMLALAKLTVQKETGFSKVVRTRVTKNAWPVFASLSWGVIMWTYRWHPDTIQPSLKSSMKYMYVYPTLCSLFYRVVGSEIYCFSGASSFGTANKCFLPCRYVDSNYWDSLRSLLLYNK